LLYFSSGIYWNSVVIFWFYIMVHVCRSR
jgi:hypothetical protein